MLEVKGIERIATLVAKRFPEEIREEIYSAAVEGVLTAVKRFSPEKGDLGAFAYSYAQGYAYKTYKELKKWRGLLSLDYEYEDKDGDEVSFGGFIGYEDYGKEEVEVEMLLNQLAEDEEEKEFLRMLMDEASQADCARAFGKSRAWATYKLKKIQEKAERLLRQAEKTERLS